VAATFYEVAIQPTAQMMTDWLCRQGEFAVHMKRDPGECDSSIRSSNMVRHVASAADTERGV
jgi:hypothetical protein